MRNMGDVERVRLVLLGGPKVGKSSIVKRFLFNTFTEKYKATVEDLYNKEYDFGSITLKVDILDTAGDLQFPAMRRLSIATAHAFLIVYAVDDESSLETVKNCLIEIQEQRADFQEIPIVVAGNKMDASLTDIQVEFDDVSDWMSNYLPVLKTKIMECSAKNDANVREIFRSFLSLSKINIRNDSESEGANNNKGLRRRSSIHGVSKFCGKSRNSGNTPCSTPPNEPSSPICRSRPGSGYSTPVAKAPSSPSTLSTSSQFLTTDDPSPFGRNKFKSRSLIRRCSKKVKKQVQDASEGPGNCNVN